MNRKLKDKVMLLAWQLIKRNGFGKSDALVLAWANVKLRRAMEDGIVKFYFRRVDGTVREAYGTLCERIIPPVTGRDRRERNDTVQTFWDSEKRVWRCFKKANLVKVA